MRTSKCVAIAMTAALFLTAPAALAQDTPPPTPTQPPPPPPPPPEPPRVVTTTVAPPGGPAAHEEKDDGISDHEKVIGHVGVGYLGVSDLPISAGGGTGAAPARASVAAPVIGVRYWLAEKVGLDLGVGFGMTSGSTETVNGAATVSTDLGSRFGLALHAGVPLVFAHVKHFKFLLVPELNVGFTNQSNQGTGPNPPTVTLSGFRLDVGARIGGEIHFGFIGVPQLALQATVGAFVKREAWKTSVEVAGTTTSASTGATQFGTSVQSDPWALFTNNIAAIYYFP
ncbi:MAG: hypothetical protein KF819_03005 [Labilithrix sp.]|nr:hypothetical protein [Labilithrix sp.]